MILDVVIEQGNPADSERLLPMIKRHINNYGDAPRQLAVDGGYASKDNLQMAKACGIEDVAFHKKCALQVEDMVRSAWVYRQLRNFRAGISLFKTRLWIITLYLEGARALYFLCMVIGGIA